MRAILVRLMDNGVQTLGRFWLFDGAEQVFSCYTLEPSWAGNKRDVSCIPAGDYKLVLRAPTTKIKYDHLAVSVVPGRDAILVHAGNTVANTSGCILVGDRVADLNRDGQDDVTNSRATLKALMMTISTPCPIHIVAA